MEMLFEKSHTIDLLNIARDWRISTDPEGTGLLQGWHHIDFNDQTWQCINGGRSLAQEGISAQDIVWYRKKVSLPDAWADQPVYFALGGISDAGTLFVNGEKFAELMPGTSLARHIFQILPEKHSDSLLLAIRIVCQTDAGGLSRYPLALATDRLLLGGSELPLYHGWKFAQDVAGNARQGDWHQVDFNDNDWPYLKVEQDWEANGKPDDHAASWLRRQFEMPSIWEGEKKHVAIHMFDNLREIYLNGEIAVEIPKKDWRHEERPKTSFFDVTPFLKKGINQITLRIDGWVGKGLTRLPLKIVSDNDLPEAAPRVDVPFSRLQSQVPAPVLPSRPDWVKMYWKAWQIALKNVRNPSIFNGFSGSFMDAAFSDNIFHWDTCFIVMFGRYAWHFLPAAQSLDNFYNAQDADGFICREIRMEDGKNYLDKQYSKDTINPPLFSWTEWYLYKMSGDRNRLEKVLPNLNRYYEWVERHRSWQEALSPNKGLYWTTTLASGMDNSPRTSSLNPLSASYQQRLSGGKQFHHHADYAWIDFTAQQALNALCMARIAKEIADDASEDLNLKRFEQLKVKINSHMWDELSGFYYDRDAEGLLTLVKTVGGFWPMLAEIADDPQCKRLIAHLEDPREFKRPHLVPTLSADHPEYHARGDYWKGGVWTPTNYMITRALMANGYHQKASEIATNHLAAIADVFRETGTFWESYAPEKFERGELSRADFIGWTGCAPISMLIENILGFEIDAPEKTICWRINLQETHGIENLRFGEITTSLMLEKGDAEEFNITVESDGNYSLALWLGGEKKRYDIQPGKVQLAIK